MPTTPNWLVCQTCDFETPEFISEIGRIREPVRYHRKQWEYAYVLTTARALDLVGPEKYALGFGVGTEPVAAVLAADGAHVTATDFDHMGVANTPLVQHNKKHYRGRPSLRGLNQRLIAQDSVFNRSVDFQYLDILDAETPLARDGYDLVWSCGVLHHLGSAKAIVDALTASTARLAPGGWALHTLDVQLTGETGQQHHDIYFASLGEIADLFEKFAAVSGHKMTLNLDRQTEENDRDPAAALRNDRHLCLQVDDLVIGSVGIAISAPSS